MAEVYYSEAQHRIGVSALNVHGDEDDVLDENGEPVDLIPELKDLTGAGRRILIERVHRSVSLCEGLQLTALLYD
jgi:hypothetical protein